MNNFPAEFAVNPATLGNAIHQTQEDERKGKSEGESDEVIHGRETPAEKSWFV